MDDLADPLFRKFITVGGIARILMVTKRTVYRMHKIGAIPRPHQFLPRGRLLWEREVIEKWLEEVKDRK